MPRNLLSILAVVTLLIAFIVLWESPPAAFSRDKGDPNNRKPTARSYLTDVKTTQYGENGVISYLFTAEKISFFQRHPKRRSKGDYTDIEAPRLILLGDNREKPWNISALNGRSQGKKITLSGDVLAWQENAQGQRTELSTSKLVLEPERQYAQTNKPVMISSPGSKTQAIGLQFDLKENKLVLTSEVRGIYESQYKESQHTPTHVAMDDPLDTELPNNGLPIIEQSSDEANNIDLRAPNK